MAAPASPLVHAARRTAEPYELPVVGSLRVARWATLIAGVSAFAAAVIGIGYGQQRLYQSDELLLVQAYGQDIVVLLVTLPILANAVWIAHQGSARGLVAWAGCLIYLAYWYHYMLAAAQFSAAYLVHVALVASSLAGLAALGMSLDVERFAHRFSGAYRIGWPGGVLVFAGCLFGVAAVSDVLQRLGNDEVLGNATRGVYNVDLTIMLPATIAAGVLLWHRHSWGYALAGPLFVNAALSVVTVLVAVVVLLAMGQPLRGVAGLLVLATATLGAVAVAWVRRVRV
jgi:hypothetical protein